MGKILSDFEKLANVQPRGGAGFRWREDGERGGGAKNHEKVSKNLRNSFLKSIYTVPRCL